MANYKGHTIGGLIVGGLVIAGSYALKLGEMPDGGVLLKDAQLLAGILILSVLFGLWPDVDTNSKAQDLFFGTAFLADIYLLINEQYPAAAFLGLIAMTRSSVRTAVDAQKTRHVSSALAYPDHSLSCDQ